MKNRRIVWLTVPPGPVMTSLTWSPPMLVIKSLMKNDPFVGTAKEPTKPLLLRCSNTADVPPVDVQLTERVPRHAHPPPVNDVITGAGQLQFTLFSGACVKQSA